MGGDEAEMRRLTERLRAAEEALRLRDRVLAIVAHDLKNPLNVIELNSQLLREATPEEQVASADRIRAAARRMRALIRELIDVASLEAHRGNELHYSATDLVALTRQMVGELGQLWTDRTLSFEAAAPVLAAAVDRLRIERVLANLLSNALKFSLPGGAVRVTVAAAPGQGTLGPVVVIEVIDTGIGIPEAAHPHLFRAFRRGPNVLGRVHGDGLGLASAHDVVTSHGGTLTFRSVEGEGSTFTVRLPVERPPPG